VTRDRLVAIEDDVVEIKTWCRDHQQSHIVDSERLNLVLDLLNGHNQNHHGMVTEVKRGGALAGVTAIAVAVFEVIYRLIT